MVIKRYIPALKVRQSQNDFFKLTFFPKNERKNLTLLLWYLRLTCFHSFFGRNWRQQKDISKLNDLYCQRQKYCRGQFRTYVHTYYIVHIPLADSNGLQLGSLCQITSPWGHDCPRCCHQKLPTALEDVEAVWGRGSLCQGLLYRWTEHSILSMTTGGGKQCLIMLHKLTQSLWNFKKDTFLDMPKVRAWSIFTLSMPSVKT